MEPFEDNPADAVSAYCVMLYHPHDTPPVQLIRSLRNLQVSLVSTVSAFDALARLLLLDRDLPDTPQPTDGRRDSGHPDDAASSREDRTEVRPDPDREPRLILLVINPRMIPRFDDLIAALDDYLPRARVWTYEAHRSPQLAPFVRANRNA
ncbi:MAG: hypothetical protein ACOC0P_06245 [Planctomycetota bacterium]